MAKVLVIEDDPMVASSIADWLESEGHRAETVYDGSEGLEALLLKGFDLAIVDWQLPSLAGPEICAKFRAKGGRTPILMLTQKSNIVDKETGLECGADDYLTKPFDLRELRARVRALLRRSSGLFEDSREVGQLTLDYSDKSLVIRGRKVALLPREFDLIEFLLRHPRTFFSAEKLLDHVWSSESYSGDQALRTCLSRLRSKIDEPGMPSIIETSKGWGYKIADVYLESAPNIDKSTS
ncbi:MAG: response regulator transcription factor [Candidatus Obscuribacterales bacterium]|nr:response regulator transcription factor [Candidatus Obscuribacterales bacterium]